MFQDMVTLIKYDTINGKEDRSSTQPVAVEHQMLRKYYCVYGRLQCMVRQPRWSSGYTRLWIRHSRVQSWLGRWIFSERKNPEYDFLRMGSKAMGPMS